MTDHRAHSRAPLRRSTAPQKILAAGLATATCVGLVGVVGARTLASQSQKSQPAPEPAVTSAPVLMAATIPTTSTGLTQADLDAYATSLATERDKLDSYRDKLVAMAKTLQRQAARQAGRAASPSSGQQATGLQTSASTGRPARPAARPAAASRPAAPAPAPQKPAAKPAPQPAPAPAPQSNTASS